jgi:hypothetical protein
MTPAEQSAASAFHRAYYAAWTDGRATIDLSAAHISAEARCT